MANRSLNTLEIAKLTSISAKQALAIDARQEWPGREGKRILAQAVKERLPFFTIGNRRFKIRYTTHFNGSVFVSPDSGGFTPCGYFQIDRLEAILNVAEGLEDYAD